MMRIDTELQKPQSHLSTRKSAAMRHRLQQQSIAEVAYYKAEKRGFAPGLEVQDWMEAEWEIRFGLA